MKEKKQKTTRTLNAVERKISHALPKKVRRDFYLAWKDGKEKEFYALLLSDAQLNTSSEDCAQLFWEKLQYEIDIYAEILEYLSVCESKKLPELDDLKKALQASLVSDDDAIDRQVNLVVPLFYERKPSEYETEFKKISYLFLDKLATKNKLFTGNMLGYIFFGDYFSVASGVLLAKHAKLLAPVSCVCRMKLHTMLMTVAQQEGFIAESAEDIALSLFEKALERPLSKEEISLLIIYSLMQIYEWQMIDSHKRRPSLLTTTKHVVKAVEYCEAHGYEDLSKWDHALTVTEDRILWERQVALITRYLLRINLKEYSDLKTITYRFILRSFQSGYLSSEIIDFIFDGRLFSNASTVMLALSSNALREHNLFAYIQEKLIAMMKFLIKQERLDVTPKTVADYLLLISLNRGISKEELAILNTYVLLQAFT